MAFLNCNSVTDSASSCVLGSAPPAVDAAAAAATAALAGLFRQSRPLPISALRDLFGPVFISGTVLRSNRSNWGISEESLPRRKDSLRSSHISMFIFWSQSFYFFFFFSVVQTPSGHPRGHHVRWWKLNTDIWRMSFTEHHVSRVLCLNSDFTVERFFSHLHPLFSLKWHERQSY